MLIALLLAAAPPPQPPAQPPLPPVCDIALDHVSVVQSVGTPESPDWVSCFGPARTTSAGPDDDVIGAVSINPAASVWLAHVTLIDANWGNPVFKKSVTGPPEQVKAMILEARDTVIGWRATLPQRQAADRKTATAFKKVVVVVDSHLAFPGAERAALNLVLNRLQKYGLSIVDHVFANEKADEVTTLKVVLLTADVVAKPGQGGGAGSVLSGSSLRSFPVNVHIKLFDGSVRVADEAFEVRGLGINIDNALQQLSAAQARPHARTVAEEHGDRLAARLIDHFELEAPKPPTR